MHDRRLLLLSVVVLGVLIAMPLRVCGNEADEAVSLEQRAIAIIDAVLDNHIDPPTRQEMALDGR